MTKHEHPVIGNKTSWDHDDWAEISRLGVELHLSYGQMQARGLLHAVYPKTIQKAGERRAI